MCIYSGYSKDWMTQAISMHELSDDGEGFPQSNEDN